MSRSAHARAHSVWLPANVLKECEAEASRWFPLESGGTFMGYSVDAHTTVVTAVIGPGPNAARSPVHFRPDEGWQLAEIARHYALSERRETYLGDWHSHPNASSGKLSRRDRRVLKCVIETAEARCPRPLMAILFGTPRDWRLALWRARLAHLSLFGARLRVAETNAVAYDARCTNNT